MGGLRRRQPAEQKRGLRGAERECPQLLEHAGVDGEVGLAFQADSPAGAAQVHDARARALVNWRIASDPTPAAACARC